MSQLIQHELDNLNRDIEKYRRITGKFPEEILLKQGGKLAFNLSRRLKKFMPEKGIVTEERLAALKQGEGVYVRPKVRESVYAKYGARTDIAKRVQIFGKKGRTFNKAGLNLQALAVKRELAVRESGRGFISFAARFGGLKGLKPNERRQWLNRYSRYLASVGFVSVPGAADMTFAWGGGDVSDDVAKVLNQSRTEAEVVAAIKETGADIREYTSRKERENAKGSFR
jgi:hypothetical protein